jgi:Baseplate J-like protein
MQQVIYLEVEDDLPAIRDLLGGAQARRVLLVVPKGSRTFRDPLHLRLLRRYAADLALDVALVTRDSRTRRLAGEEGVAVVSTIRRGRQGRWRSGTPRRMSSAQQAAAARVDGLRSGRGDAGYGDRIIAWAGRILAVLLFVFFLVMVVTLAALVVPEAKVTVEPYREVVEVSLSIRADPEMEKSSLSDSAIPARVLEAEVEQTGEVATLSKKDAPDAPAVGTLTFINQTATSVKITPGAIVRTATGTTVRFRTVTTATLEASIGATAQAQIEALEPGPVGNVDKATITEVETPALRGKVRVINEEPTRGGGVKQVGVVTRADMDRLKAQLL